MTRKYFPLIFCAHMVALAAVLPRLVEPEHGGLLALLVVVFVAASLACLYLMGSSYASRGKRPATALPAGRQPVPGEPVDDAGNRDASTIDDAPVADDAIETLAARFLDDLEDPLARSMRYENELAPEAASWIATVARSYGLSVLVDCSRQSWGPDRSEALDDAFTRHLLTVDAEHAQTYRRLRHLLREAHLCSENHDESVLLTIEHCLAMDLLEGDPRSILRQPAPNHGNPIDPSLLEGLDVVLARCLSEARSAAGRVFERTVPDAEDAGLH